MLAAIKRAAKIADCEVAGLLWSCAYFFFLLSSYYVLRPLRDALAIAGNVATLPWLYMGTLGAMLVSNPLFAALVSRFPRRRFIPIVYVFFILNLLGFYFLLEGRPLERSVHVARVFFVWTSVFNLFAVSIFWGFMADLYRPEQGARLFGFIGVGGTLGAMAGAGLTARLAVPLGPIRLLLVAALLLGAALGCVAKLVKMFGVDGELRSPRAPGLSQFGVLGALGRAFASRYLLGICLFMLLYTMSSTFVYFEQARIVSAAVKDSARRTALFATIDLWVNGLGLVLQVFFTARIIRALGVAATLAVLPVLTLVGFAWLGFLPVLSTVVAFQVLRRGLEYGAARPARELLFTVLAREDKYKTKSFIDTFVYRGGDSVGAWTFSLLSRSLGAPAAVYFGISLCVAWAVLAIALGRRQAQLARSH